MLAGVYFDVFPWGCHEQTLDDHGAYCRCPESAPARCWSCSRVICLRLAPASTPAATAWLIASEPLADAAGAICLWPTDWQVDDLRARRADAQRVSSRDAEDDRPVAPRRRD